jgi:hypothetical protein
MPQLRGGHQLCWDWSLQLTRLVLASQTSLFFAIFMLMWTSSMDWMVGGPGLITPADCSSWELLRLQIALGHRCFCGTQRTPLSHQDFSSAFKFTFDIFLFIVLGTLEPLGLIFFFYYSGVANGRPIACLLLLLTACCVTSLPACHVIAYACLPTSTTTVQLLSYMAGLPLPLACLLVITIVTNIIILTVIIIVTVIVVVAVIIIMIVIVHFQFLQSIYIYFSFFVRYFSLFSKSLSCFFFHMCI